MNYIKFHKTKNDVFNYLEQKNIKPLDNDNSENQKSIKKLIEIIKGYFSGRKSNLVDAINSLDVKLNLEEKFHTEFSRKVADVLIDLNYGELTSYFEIGKKIDSKAYQAIGNVLKNNPLPLIIPCHRVIRKSGDIGGFMGKTNEGWQQALKKKLILLESTKLSGS
ncbi:MAG: methylated-DNA--[protein]-cysteine S-methyltransferase [Promethearchaeota archaeon]